MENKESTNFKELEFFYGRKLSIVKIAAIMSRIAIVNKLRFSRIEKRNGNRLSLWIKKNWNIIKQYLPHFHFFFNEGEIPKDMFCIYKGNM